MDRCHERDGRGARCTIEGEHQEVVNTKGQRAYAHETAASVWSTPLSRLHVVRR
jgi:hypothetical protein